MVCVWNMGANYGDTSYNVPIINPTTSHNITFTYIEDDIGRHTITVNCSNEISSQNLTIVVHVALNNITIGALTCRIARPGTFSVTCLLNIVQFGTGACLEWDMGDGEPPVYYRDGYCAAGVPTPTPVYAEVLYQVIFVAIISRLTV